MELKSQMESNKTKVESEQIGRSTKLPSSVVQKATAPKTGAKYSKSPDTTYDNMQCLLKVPGDGGWWLWLRVILMFMLGTKFSIGHTVMILESQSPV